MQMVNEKKINIENCITKKIWFIGVEVELQITKAIKNFNYTELDISKYELIFNAKNLPAMGYKVFYVEKLDSTDELQSVEGDGKYSITNKVSAGCQESLCGFNQSSKRTCKNLILSFERITISFNSMFPTIHMPFSNKSFFWIQKSRYSIYESVSELLFPQMVIHAQK